MVEVGKHSNTVLPWKSKDYFLNGFSVKTIVLVRVYYQKVLGNIIFGGTLEFQELHESYLCRGPTAEQPREPSRTVIKKKISIKRISLNVNIKGQGRVYPRTMY